MGSLERLTPQNIEAEQSFLGSLLLDKDAMIKVADEVRPDDFYVDKHRRIFESMLDLYRRNEPIDLLSLGNRLQEKNELDLIGGRAELISLANAVPTSVHVGHYGDIIQKKSTLRRLIQAAHEITGLGYQEAEDVEVVLDSAEKALFNVSQKFMKRSFTPINEVLDDAFERIDEVHRDKDKLRGIPTGYPDLDNLLGGLQKSDLFILAARPSCGKTAFVLDLARHAAVKHHISVGLFSLEMSKEQLVDRMLCAEANVDLWKMRTGKLTNSGVNDDFTRIGHAMGVLSDAPIYIDDSSSANVMEIRTKARRLQMEHGLGLLIIDYLQLMEGRSKNGVENRVLEIGEISRGLKQLARELNIPVIALSQLARAVELQKPAIPRLAHLRDSGSIEQDADVVAFIYRKAADKNYRLEDLSPEERNSAEIHIAKHRNGPTGMVKLYFDAERASFKSLARNGMAQPAGLAPAMQGTTSNNNLPPAPNQPF